MENGHVLLHLFLRRAATAALVVGGLRPPAPAGFKDDVPGAPPDDLVGIRERRSGAATVAPAGATAVPAAGTGEPAALLTTAAPGAAR